MAVLTIPRAATGSYPDRSDTLAQMSASLVNSVAATSARKQFRAPWPIFLAAFALRVACIFIGRTYRVPAIDDHFHFGFEMGRIARSLVEGRGYADPFDGPSGPTAWVPPLYPLLMALSFKLFGVYTKSAAAFLLVCNSVFSAAIVPAVYEIAARSFDARGIARRGSKYAEPVAMWSAWLWAVYPAALQYAIHWLWEMSLSTCLFTWTLVFALRLKRVGEHSPAQDDKTVMNGAPRLLGTWLVFGVLWGLVALSNSSLLLCFPATMIWILWGTGNRKQEGGNRKRALLGVMLACMMFVAVMMPWWVRNERAFHTFVATRSNFGLELYNSSRPMFDGWPWGTAMPMWAGDPEFREYVRMGEVPFVHAKGIDAMQRLRGEKGLWLKWTLNRFFFFWDGPPKAANGHWLQEYLRNLSYAFLSACGLLGLALALRRHVEGAGLMLLAFLLVPLVYYLVTVQARFRHPLEPLLAVLGVYLFRSTIPKQRVHVDSDMTA